MAHCRVENNVPELDQSAYGTYVSRKGDGWRVKPQQRLWKRLGVKGRELYCEGTRSCTFPDKNEADVALEKFMAPSTSDVERKAMLYQPREAYTCAHCGLAFKGATRVRSRQIHESSCAPEQSSSSEEEDSDEPVEEEEPGGRRAAAAEARAVLMVALGSPDRLLAGLQLARGGAATRI